MKNRFFVLVSIVLLVLLTAALCLPASAQRLILPAYSSNTRLDRGILRPAKDGVVYAGNAGGDGDSIRWFVPGVKGDAIPVIDGVAGDTEGYADFENFDDYLYVAAIGGGDTQFADWYNQVKKWDLIVKWCWDGEYLYLYFEYTIDNYVCNISSGTNMWQWNCVQVGLADMDAYGFEGSETGYAVSGKGESYATSWAGNYAPVDNVDYKGITTKKGITTTLHHELRINLTEALGLASVSSGDRIRMAWSIMSDNTGSNKNNGLNFCMGIAFDGKHSEYFGIITLAGDVEKQGSSTKRYYQPDELDIDLEYSTASSIFFADIQETNDFVSKDNLVQATFHGEDTIQYMNLKSLEGTQRYYSERRYPVNLWASEAQKTLNYAVIRYRANSDDANLGLNYISLSMTAEIDENGNVLTPKGYIDSYAVYPTETTQIVRDGQWHYAVYPMMGAAAWEKIIESIALEVTGDIDVEGIRFFGWDPSEKYDLSYDPDGDTEIEYDDDDESPVASTPSTVESTEESKPVDDKPVKKKGCKSMTGSGGVLILLMTAFAGCAVRKKKEN